VLYQYIDMYYRDTGDMLNIYVVQFSSQESADLYTPPIWTGTEVTNDFQYDEKALRIDDESV
jgi:CYTH domain-containing protein